MEPITMIAGYAIKRVILQSIFSELPDGSIPVGDQDGNGLMDYAYDADGDTIIDTLINII